jgi:hypothetical protein
MVWMMRQADHHRLGRAGRSERQGNSPGGAGPWGYVIAADGLDQILDPALSDVRRVTHW